MLQIDMRMPNNCINCPLTHDYVCLVTDRYLDESLTGAYGEERPDWCPLKEQKPKTGHWVSVNDEDIVAIDNDGFPERACFCSECKKYLIASDEYAVYGRYCPFCGAKMEGR